MATTFCDIPANPDAAPLAGRYRVIRFVGWGSQGAACVARDLERGVDVIVKMYNPAERTMEECVLEASALARIRHPNVVEPVGVGFECGAPYLVLEFVDGPALQIHRQRKPLGRLPRSEALRITLGVLAALEACHGAGFVHGSPHQNNVMLRGGVEPVLIDFGRVRPVGATDEASTQHDVGQVGQLLLTLLTGYTPKIFDEDERLRALAQLWNSQRRKMLNGMQLDARLVDVALRAAEPDPDLRFQDARAMRQCLEALGA